MRGKQRSEKRTDKKYERDQKCENRDRRAPETVKNIAVEKAPQAIDKARPWRAEGVADLDGILAINSTWFSVSVSCARYAGAGRWRSTLNQQ